MGNKVEVKMVSWFNEHWYKINALIEEILKTFWIPSVTTKLGIIDKPFLPKWRGDIGNREADMRVFEAGQRGTRIHHGFNVLVKGGSVIYNPSLNPVYKPEEILAMVKESKEDVFVCQYQDEMLQLLKLQRWMEVVNPKILFAEKTVYSLPKDGGMGDAGTADLGVFIEGGTFMVNGSRGVTIPTGNYIIDLKTGNAVGDEAYYQTACYARCATEMGLGAFNRTIILHTSSRNKGGIEGLSTLLRDDSDVMADYKAYRLASDLWEIKNKGAEPRDFEFPSILKLNQKKEK